MGDDLCVAQVQEWADGLAELQALIGRRFARSEPREHAMAYIRGLLSAEEQKNSWTLSEQAGDATPNGMQRLLSTTDWDPDLVRDDLQRYVVAHLGDPGGVLIIDLCRPWDYADHRGGRPRDGLLGRTSGIPARRLVRHIHSASRKASSWSVGR